MRKNFIAEVESLKNLKHPNLINLIACNDNGIIDTPRGKMLTKIIYLVLELAIGGEIFDYVALGGRFS